jgi:F-type H+-transporting ATPase subunit epsilon
MAEKKGIRCTVITPERQVLDETADAVVIPAHDGEVGILLNRAALMCQLGLGQFRYQKGGQIQRVFIDGGFAQVVDNDVTVLTSSAIPAADISPETLAEAERAVEELRGHDPETLEARRHAQRKVSVLRTLQGTS